MSIWKEVQKNGNEVRIDGTPFAVGQRVPMGLGSIELRYTQETGFHVVRFSQSGYIKYSLRLSRDGERYRLGPEYGHRIITPSEETDPIKRILREMDIPVSRLERTSEPTLKVDERWYDNRHCPIGLNTNQWIHDGHETDVSSEIREQSHGYFSGGGYDIFTIEGASYAIRIDSGRYMMNGCDWSRPGKIVVWPHCDANTLANALALIV